MIKLMKYLKKSAGYIVLIIALLFLQAYCDLSLPDYTSKIINVGIQQKGIEDSVPDKLRDSTLQNLQIFMDEDQKKEVSQNYTQEEDTWAGAGNGCTDGPSGGNRPTDSAGADAGRSSTADYESGG